MRLRLFARFAACAVGVALAAGCAGPTNVTPWQSPATLFAGSAAGMSIDDAPMSKLIAGTWRHDAGSQCPPSAGTRGSAGGNAGSNAGTLFVGDYGPSHLEEYDASGLNQSPIGVLSNSIKNPYGFSVDLNGMLYVANWGNNNVLEFPQGATSPSIVLSGPILAPLDVAADHEGNVYVVNGRGGPILIYPPGPSSNPQQLGGFKYPTGVAFDSQDNLYVVDQLYGNKAPLGAVFEIAHGSSTLKNLNLTKLDYPVGVALDASDSVTVTNLGNNTVTEYAQGATVPKRVIGGTTGALCDPVFLAYNAQNVLYVANNSGSPNGNVTGYKPTTKKPFVTLTHNMAGPRGVAVNPNWQPSK